MVAEWNAAGASAEGAPSLTEVTENEWLTPLSRQDWDCPHLRVFSSGKGPREGLVDLRRVKWLVQGYEAGQGLTLDWNPRLCPLQLCSKSLIVWCQSASEELPETGPLCLNPPPPLAAGFPVFAGKTPGLPESDMQEPGHGRDAPESHGFSLFGDYLLYTMAHGSLILESTWSTSVSTEFSNRSIFLTSCSEFGISVCRRNQHILHLFQTKFPQGSRLESCMVVGFLLKNNGWHGALESVRALKPNQLSPHLQAMWP